MSSTAERVAALSSVPLLAGLTQTQLDRLARSSGEGIYPAGDLIVRQGEKGSGLFLLLDGTAEVRRGGEVRTVLGPGQFFGEAALLVDAPRTADVRATSDVTCLILHRWDFWSAVGIDPQQNRALYEQTVQRLRAFRGELVE